MKPIKIGSLPDGAEFRISDSPVAVTYALQSKKGKKAIYTSLSSGKTYQCSLATVVYVTSSKSKYNRDRDYRQFPQP